MNKNTIISTGVSTLVCGPVNNLSQHQQQQHMQLWGKGPVLLMAGWGDTATTKHILFWWRCSTTDALKSMPVWKFGSCTHCNSWGGRGEKRWSTRQPVSCVLQQLLVVEQQVPAIQQKLTIVFLLILLYSDCSRNNKLSKLTAAARELQ